MTATTTAEAIARELGGRRSGAGWTARCPVHEDRDPSLSISETVDGTVLVHCHAGCSQESVIEALKARNLWREDETTVAPERIVARYGYTDEGGTLLFEVLRYQPKTFRARQPDGRGGWIWNLEGVRRVLYRLPDLLEAKAVFIAEGERDCESLAKLALVATCNPAGAGKWREEHSTFLRGKRVAIIPDNDPSGRHHALKVAESLLSVAASVRILEVPKGKDVTEWLALGGNKNKLIQLARAAEELDTAKLGALRVKWFPSAQVEDEADPEPSTLKVPSLIWHGLAERFIELLDDSTEAPREYRLAAFLTVAGALIGRRAWVTYSRPVYANLYTLLIGETANPRKTTVTSFGLDLMSDVAERTGAKVKPLYGLASVEGLAAAMKDGDSPEPYRTVAIEDELKSLIRKSQQKGVANLIPRLTELYNSGRRFEVNTRAERISIENPFLAIISGSTPGWFGESIGESEISGGFLNRWCMFTGRPEKLIPFPEAPHRDKWTALVADLSRAIQQSSGEFVLTAEAEEIFTGFYTNFRGRRTEGLRTEATARTDLQAVKFGLLYAILDEHSQVEAEDIARGIALATYTMDVAASLVGEVGMSRIGASERKLLRLLKGGRVTTREAMRKLHVSADDLTRITRALEKVGLIEITSEATHAGHRRIFLESA